MLNDKEIKMAIRYRDIAIDPYDPILVQPNSVDLRLGGSIYTYDPDQDIDTLTQVPQGEQLVCNSFKISPGEFILAETLECIYFPSNFYGIVMGKSSIGRLGVDVVNAGVVDSGFKGTITLELFNKSSNIYTFHKGQPIAQLMIDRCIIVGNLYDGKYQNQYGATPSRIVKPEQESGDERKCNNKHNKVV